MRFAATRPVCRAGFPLLLMALVVAAASAPGQALALDITTASLSDATAGVAYSDSVVATNGTTPYVWSLDSGSLPSGISLDTDTGALTGAATLAETRAFIVRVEDALGDTATRPLSITVTAAAAAALAYEQPPGTIVAGVAFSPALSVSVRDAFGNLVTGATDAVTLAVSAGTGSLVGTTTVNAVSGVATFGALTIEVAGTGKQLTASSGALTPAVSAAFDVTAGAAAALAYEQPPGTIVAGVAFSPALSVSVRDAFGNLVTGATDAVSLAVSAGTGSLVGTTTVNAVSGVATFGALTIEVAGTGKQLTASSGALTPAVSATFDVTAGAAAALAYEQQPGTIVAGVAFSPALSVSVRDAFGNLVTGATDAVSLAVTAGTGSLVGTTTVNAVSGVATFGALTIEVAGTGKQLTASSGALTPAVSAAFDVTAGAAAALAYEQPPGTIVAGVAFSPALSVSVRDAFGNLVNTATDAVTLAVSAGTGSLVGTTTVNAIGGVATFGTLTIEVAGTGKQLTASSGALTPAVSATFDVTAGAAAVLAYEQPPGTIVAGVAFSPALAVSVRDAFGNLVTGATDAVTLAVTSGTGSLMGTTTVNAVSGVATFGALTIEVAGTGKQLTASSGALTPAVSATFDVTAGAAAALAYEQQPGTIVAGVAFSPALSVSVRDAFGNLVTGATDAVTLAVSAGTGSLVGTTTVNAVSGVATFGALTIEVAGTGKQLTASSGALTPAVSAPFDVTAGAAAALAYEQPPGTIVAGVAFSPALSVSVRDAFGNLVTGATDAVTLAVTSGTGSLVGTTTVNAIGGVATFGALTIEVAGTGKQLTASSGALTPAVSAPFDVTAGAAAVLAYEQQPGTIVAGVAFSPALSVSVRDAFGNLVTGATDAVSLAVSAGTGSLVGTTTVNAIGGVATFGALTIEVAGTGKQLTASSGALTPAVSAPFDVTAGAAAALAYEQQPGAIVAGAAFSPALAVSVRDAFGNLVTGATDAVTLAVTSGTGSLVGTTTVNAIGGVATFGALTIEVAGTGKQLTASSGALTPAVSAPFDVTAGAAAVLAYEQPPGTFVAGVAFSPALSVSVRDAFGNLVTGATDAVSLAVTAGTGSLVGTTTVNAVSGVATFGALTIEVAGTGKQLTASSGALTPAVSAAFDVTAGAAAALAYEQQPGTIVAGVAFSPALSVSVRDAFGNLVTGATDAVSLAVSAGTGSLVGTTTVNAVSGVATFGALTIEVAGTGKQLTASSGALTPAVSAAFDVTAGAAAALAYEQQPGTIVAGVAFSPALSVSVRDAFGNLVTGATDAVTLAVSAGTGSLVGTTTVNAVSGVATFGALTIEVAGTGKQLTASSGALTPAVSATFDVTAGAAAVLAYEQQPGTIVAGVAFSPALSVSVRDAFGNLVTGATDAVTLAVTSGTGSLMGTTTVNAVSGVATFGALTIEVAGTGKQLTASAGALTPAVSATFDVTAGAAAALAYEQQPGTIAAGAAFSPALSVSVRDAFGNLVTGATDAVTLAVTAGTGSLVGTTTVNAIGGVATFGALTIEVAGTGKQLTASAGALTPAVSATFDVTAGAAAALAYEQQPGTIVAGVAFSPALSVSVRDAFGNLVTGATDAVTLAVTSGTGSLVGTTTVNAIGGVAAFGALTIEVAGTGKQLTASSGALTPAVSAAFDVTAGAAAVLAYEQQPGTIVAGVAFSPALSVSVRDAFGNLVTGATDAVTLAVTSGTGSLVGTTTVNAIGGVATFGALTIEVAGTGKQLTASSGALTPAVSAAFDVTAAAASALAYEQPPGTIVAGVAFSPALSVSVRDAFGNLVTGATDAVTLAVTSGTGSLVGTTTVNAIGGVATFGALTIEVAGTGKQLTASSGALTPAVSAAFDVTAAAASALAYEQPPGTIVAGVAFSPALSVSVRDAFGNLVTGATDAVTLAVTSGTGSLVGTTTVNAIGGVATFGALTIEVAGTGKQLTASSGALTPAVSAAFDVTTGAATVLAFDQQPSAVIVGATITPAVKVKATDVFGNGVSGELVGLSLVGNGTLTGGASVATDGNGVATFAGLSVNREGSKQLGATTGTLGPVPSDPFTVSCPVITVTPTSLPSGTSGTAYSETISASGGTAPYSFAVTAGALPAGLTLSPLGLLSGTPTVDGTFGFTITASDADSCLGSRVYGLFLCPVIAVLPATAPSASIGVAYSQAFTASAGVAPFTFAVTSGALPTGLSLSAAGLLSGTPTATGTFPFTIGVTAADGCTGSRVYSIDVLGIPSAVTDLAASRVVTGNDGDGTSKILIAFTMPPGGVLAEVYRAPFGHYPQYDDAGGAVPATPGYPPGPPWSLTAVTASGQADEPATRDFHHYIVFTKNAGGGVSAVSNKTGGTGNYALGDVSNGVVAGTGNNLVGSEDISLLGANYGIGAAEIVSRGVPYLDVGPTIDFLISSRPFTDQRINFEDLVVFATNFGVVSAPQLALKAADDAVREARVPERFQVQAPSLVEAGQVVTAVLRMEGGGRTQAFSAALSWDASVVEPVEMVSGGFVEDQGGLTLSPRAGTVDAALLGVRAPGISGEGDVARVTFRALRQGDAAIRLGDVIARDAANRPLSAGAIAQATQVDAPARTLLLSPWPNPTRGSATLAFALAKPGDVDLALYSVDGRRIRTIVSGLREAGLYRESWTGDDDDRRAVAPGVYFAQLTADGRRFTKRIVHLR